MDGGAGFWIFIAALVVGGMWSDARKKAEKHETLRRIVEKTGTIDEARLKELFSDENPEVKPGYSYRGLRVAGTIVLFLAAGIATFFLVAAGLGKLFGTMEMFRNITGLVVGLAVSAGIAVVGLGLFFSSRFATPPSAAGTEPPTR
ncbi:MAG TPA: hypothetical protein VM146_01330 [Steroidobacteraceae bacterium]|nr:hypothetical protein [Steroidobacteraceae bacterium]